MRGAAAIALVCATFGPFTARALSDAERDLLSKSLRATERKSFDAATGGLEALPLVTAEFELTPDARTIAGEVRIDWPNRTGRALDHVVVRITSNGENREAPFIDFTNVKASVDGAPAVAVTGQILSEHLTKLPLPRALAPGKRVVLTGLITGRLANAQAGSEDLMTSSLRALSGGQPKAAGDQYGTFACGEQICTLTGFIPEIPSFMSGSFDTVEGSGIGDATFSDPVNAIFTVVAPTRVTLAATGIEIGHAPAGDGRMRTTFVIAGAREIGVVASADFVVNKVKIGDLTIRSLSKRADRDGGKRALEAAKSALHTFEQAFGKYPWTHLDLAESALTGGAGGVELPALALGASGFYQKSNPVLAMVAQVTGGDMTSEMLEFITRHEVAHQWWHAQVGSHSQLHPYLDEPLAQWSALLATKQADGADAYKRARKMQVALNFQALPLLGFGDGPVARKAGDFASVQEYAGLVYGKAPLFYEAVSKTHGEAALLAGLKRYVAEKRFRRAVPEDLLGALERSCGGGVRGEWQHWFEERHGDADLGPLDLNGITLDELPPGIFGQGGMMGGGGPQIDPAQLKDALDQLQDLMQGLE